MTVVICPCENPHCIGRHVNRDDMWLWRIVRDTLYSVTKPDIDRGDLVMAEEAILAAIRSRYQVNQDV